jgi:iturin family lipopeptide synthetase A
MGFEIAVIGMAGRFPGAGHIEEFWSNLKKGLESISFFTDKELAEAGIEPELLKMDNYVKAKGVLEDIEYFDAAFFGYTPKEAERMDPQMRILHECAWQALEQAGCVPDTCGAAIGVYVGAHNNIRWHGKALLSGIGSSSEDFYTSQLSDKDHISTRLAYKLNLSGPSFTLETQCSTSLVAVHLAGQGLLSGDCDIALAGGVSVTLPQKSGYMFQEGMIYSPDGHCRSFDAEAAGSVFGNGAGIVVLKQLDEAAAAGDHIWAVIKSSFINNDGSRKVGYTAPSVEGQAEAIRTALRLAGVESETIGYVEAHGTATDHGDQIEIEALKLAFDTEKRHFCRLGSVKSNVGHLDNAAGAAGLIKTILMLKHKLIPPSLYFKRANPEIDFDNSPFVVNTELREWQSRDYPRRAGVSSFGIGGTNAHLILEEAPPRAELPAGRDRQLLLLSARTPSALDTRTEDLGAYLQQNPGINLADVAYTLQVGRKPFKYRRMVTGQNIDEVAAGLASAAAVTSPAGSLSVAFMFPGLGAQYVNMGLGLYRNEELFRRAMDRCFAILKPLMACDLKDILYPPVDRAVKEAAAAALRQIDIAQAAVFAFEYALTELLMAWGIKPAALIGYSFGEYAAACTAGVLSLEDALQLVVRRGQLLRELPPGAMLSVPLPKEEVEPLLGDELSVAVDNGASCVVSGPTAAVEGLAVKLKEKKYLCMPVSADRALHSSMMEPVLPQFEERVKEITLNRPRLPYIAGVTGTWIGEDEAVDPAYWSKQLRRTVRFGPGLETLLSEGDWLLVEMGPGRDLSALAVRYMDSGHQLVNLVRPEQSAVPDEHYLLDRLGRLWLYGAAIDWPAFYGEERRCRLPLPTYPFEGQRYWLDDDPWMMPSTKQGRRESRLKREEMADWFYLPRWSRSQLLPGDCQQEVEPGCWLVFTAESGFCCRLVKRLEKAGVDIITVHAAAAFAKENDFAYRIEPQQDGDYRRLLAEIEESGRHVARVIHLWSVGPGAEGLTRASLAAAQEPGLFSLFSLVRALARGKPGEGMRLEVVTNGVYEVGGGEPLYPEKAPLSGLVRVIQQEYANINLKCRCIDIVWPDPGTPGEDRLSEQLWAEFKSGSSAVVAAYRDRYRWVQDFVPLRLAEGERGKGADRLQPHGVYLITGGLGTVGYSLARYLARTVKARLVLTGRQPLPSPVERDGYLRSHDGHDRSVRGIRKLLELEALGSEVLYMSVDAADTVEMRQMVNEAEARFGPIQGVIHAAGVVGGDSFRPLEELNRQGFLEQFGPKVYGVLGLAEIFGERNLDFCLLVSSLSVILGGLGFAAYAAANAFLDAFAHWFNRRSRLCWTAVNWGDWQSDRPESREAVLGNTLSQIMMNPQEGAKTFELILKYCPVNQVAVSAGDLQARIDQWVKLESLEGREGGRVGQGLTRPRPDLMNPYAAPLEPLEHTLVGIWQQVMGFDKIGTKDDFFEMGGDSLKAITVIARIHQSLDVQVPLMVFFNRPTIKGLSKYITDRAEKSRYSPIEAVEKREYYPLSSAQKRLYILQAMDKNSLGYNETQVVLLKGSIGKSSLTRAFGRLIDRHESLRTSIEMIGEEPVQRVHLPHQVACTVEYREATADDVVGLLADFVKPFDMRRPPFFRVGLIKIAGDRQVMALDIHHIISDGVSRRVCLEEFRALVNGQELPALRLQYKDFAVWQDREKTRQVIRRQGEYWLKRFGGDIPVLELPLDFNRPAVQDFSGRTVTFTIGRSRLAALKRAAAKEDVTLFMLLLALFNLLLARLSGQEDIILGIPAAGRRHPDLQYIIGILLNTLALRNFPSGHKTFRRFLQEVRETALLAFENQDYPFEELVEQLALPRDLSRNPLIDVMFIFHNELQPAPAQSPPPPGNGALDIGPYDYESTRSPFDITFRAGEAEEGLNFRVEYCSRLYKRETIERFVKYFEKIESAVLSDPGRQIADIEIMDEAEKQRLVHDFNATELEYPRAGTVHGLFAARAASLPNHTALADGDRHLSYGALALGAALLAQRLRQRGITTNGVVGLMVKRSLEMVEGLLGILEAGGAYLPLDRENPADRTAYMLADSGAHILLSRREDASLVIEEVSSTGGLVGQEEPGLHGESSLSALAYVIYTSGSTGRPKGVAVEHGSVLNFARGVAARIDFSGGKAVLALTTISFDIFALEMLLPLLEGLKIVIAPEEAQRDPNLLAGLIVKYRPGMIQLTPSGLKLLKGGDHDLECLAGVTELMVGGETFPPDLFAGIKETFNGRLYNMYGPTETTIWSTVRDLSGLDELDIGSPLANTRVYILDGYRRVQPIGIFGRLYIGGHGVARGYLNRPELTAEKFMAEAFRPQERERMYDTGDLARWQPDGSIAFGGRVDDQVKLRGFRIEMGEIEELLLRHEDIREVVVDAGENGRQDRCLCAYYVSDRELEVPALRDLLARELPSYMIPAFFVPLAAIPLTPNGKINRRALPRPGEFEVQSAASFAAPRSRIEETIARTWGEVLDLERVGIHDNFFELGGNSLNIIQLNNKLSAAFGVELPVAAMFTYPTISSLVQYLDDGGGEFFSAEETQWFKTMNKSKGRLTALRKKMA